MKKLLAFILILCLAVAAAAVAEEAGKLLMEDRRYRYSESRTWEGFENYEFSWEITGFEPGLVLTHSGTAFPCWWIEYDFVTTDENTGEQFRNKNNYVINAVTGA